MYADHSLRHPLRKPYTVDTEPDLNDSGQVQYPQCKIQADSIPRKLVFTLQYQKSGSDIFTLYLLHCL